MLVQAVAVLVIIAFSFVGSSVLLKATDAPVGLKVDLEAESNGLDLSEREENA